MAYLPLNNFKYDSGPRRIQSGPDHEGYVVLTSGVQSIGVDNGVVVAGPPLSGVLGSGQAWAYNSNWRYVPSRTRSLNETVSPVLYSASGALDSYSAAALSQPTTIAGVKVVSASESNVTFRNNRYRRSAYFGGACPDNQAYSPFNTPEANTLAEGITGGGSTHRVYENPLLINSLGSQADSDRSSWEYSQPVYCEVYTETIRAGEPGLLSTPVRSLYRGGSISYGSNYGQLYSSTFGSYIDDNGPLNFGEENNDASDYPVPEPEIDYGNIGADLWISKVVAPFSNNGYLYSPTFIGAIAGAVVVTDSFARSYCVMVAIQASGALNLVITKRNPDGTVVWSREHSFIGYGSAFYSMGLANAFIADIGDNQDSLVAFYPEYFGYQHDSFAVYSLVDGSLKSFINVGANTEPQGHTLSLGHAEFSKYVVMMRNEWYMLTYDVVDAVSRTVITGCGITPAGTAPPPSNVDTPESSSFIQFPDGSSIVIFNQYAYRILVVPLNSSFAPRSAINKRYYNCGGGCVVTRYDDNKCLVATAFRLYLFEKDGTFLKEVIHNFGYPETIQVTEDAIYLVTKQFMSTIKISLDLSIAYTRNRASANNNNFIGDGWVWSTDNGLHVPTNRVVSSYNVFSNNAYNPSPANFPVFQVFGIKASKVGSYTTLNVGEYTASAEGTTLMTPLTSYTTPTSVETNTCTLAPRLNTIIPTNVPYFVVDASSKYQWELYNVDFP